MKELPYVILVFIVTCISWIDYRKKVKKVESEEELRNGLVPYLLVMVLFATSISFFLIKLT